MFPNERGYLVRELSPSGIDREVDFIIYLLEEN